MSFEQKNSKHVRIVPLSVSQNTALERLDKDFVSAIPFDYKKVLVITLSMRVLLCALLLLICIQIDTGFHKQIRNIRIYFLSMRMKQSDWLIRFHSGLFFCIRTAVKCNRPAVKYNRTSAKNCK